jgi:triosephosphate isomerase (TIM)
MRKILVAGNWKMNTLADQAAELASGVAGADSKFGDTEVLLCPPYVWLERVKEAIKGSRVKLGGQNMLWEDSGAYTGEISGQMLKSAGCEYVIIGHSERRQYFGETNLTVNRRLKKAIEVGLTPIVCLGEMLQEREENRTEDVITKQFTEGFDSFSEFKKIVIAYEPVWAIGTGKTASPEQAQEIHRLLRELLKKATSDYEEIRLLYGGSVKPGNADELIGQPDIDGFLVGGASLKASDFTAIIQASA